MQYLQFFSALKDTIVSFAVSGGYISLLLVLILEGIPLLGVAIPGHVVIVSAGFLIATGIFHPAVAFGVALLGAIIGDYLSFLLGRKFGWKFIDKFLPYFFIKESVIIKARKFLEAHTGKALVLGRFNPVTRGLMPFFVGSNKLPTHHFFLWNTIGAIAWVTCSLAIGYALGFGFHVVTGWFSKALVIGIVFVILMIWSYKFVNLRFHVFRRYELFVLGLNIVSVLVLIRLIDDAFQIQPFMAAFDLYVNNYMITLSETGLGVFLNNLAFWVSALGGTVMLSMLTMIGGIYLAIRKRWRSVAVLLMSIGSTVFVVRLAKDVIQRVRPDNLITPEVSKYISIFFDHSGVSFDPSFPSGHASIAAAFFTVLAYLVVPRIHSWVKRELFIVLCAVSALLIGLSRVVLSVHWASDVLAGWALGIFCATASILFVRYVGALIVKKVINFDEVSSLRGSDQSSLSVK